MKRRSALEERTQNGAALPGTLGIGHTRWATHGEPNDVNSHPHLSGSRRVALVHNGIVENYAQLRHFLSQQGYAFVSDTDSEVVAQLPGESRVHFDQRQLGGRQAARDQGAGKGAGPRA